jgi:hypothetical protein
MMASWMSERAATISISGEAQDALNATVATRWTIDCPTPKIGQHRGDRPMAG